MLTIPALAPPSAPTLETSLVAMASQRISPATIAAMPYRDWIARYLPAFDEPLGERHVRVWEWFASLAPGVRPRPLVAVWPRGSGKSSTIEAAAAYLGSAPDPKRRFVLYVSETQAQADAHVQAIGSILEDAGVQRALTKYRTSRGWTQSRLRAANGFNVQAFGLDAGMRGIKLDQYRPDVIVFDDIDGRHDTEATIQKKIDTITETIMPAGSSDVATIVVQNLVHEDSIVARLADGRAEFLRDRLPVTVERAVDGLQVEQRITEDGTPRYVITGGTATWAGQDLATCEKQLNEIGLIAFQREMQQEVAETEGGLWNKQRDISPFRHRANEHGALPDMDRIVVGVDPNSDGGDAAGIVVCGISKEWGGYWHGETHGYVLADRTVEGGPDVWAAAAVAAYRDFNADTIVAEKNNGGQMVAITIGTVSKLVPVKLVHASKGKKARAEPIQVLYSKGYVHHAGEFIELEKEMTRWQPNTGQPSPNRVDAVAWALTELMLGGNRPTIRTPTGALAKHLSRQ